MIKHKVMTTMRVLVSHHHCILIQQAIVLKYQEQAFTQYSADQKFLQLTPEPSYAGLPKEIVLSSSMVDQFVHVKLPELA